MSVSTHNARRPGRRTNDSGHIVNIRNAATPEQLANVNEIIAEETARETGKPLPQRERHKPETIEDAIARLKIYGSEKLRDKLESAPPLPEEVPRGTVIRIPSQDRPEAPIETVPGAVKLLQTIVSELASLSDRLGKLEKPKPTPKTKRKAKR